MIDSGSESVAAFSDVAALDDGTFVVTYIRNTATSGSLEAKIFSLDGVARQTIVLHESNKPLSASAVQRISGSDFAFSVTDSDDGPLHVGTFRNGAIDQWDMHEHAISPEIAALNDGRFLVQWTRGYGGNPIYVATYDPRTSAVNWTGDDNSQQYAGTKHSDRLNGGGGNDTLFGGLGDDVLEGGSGVDRFDGGAGWDKVSYTGLPAGEGVVVNLTTNENGGAAEGDVLLNVEAVEGTNAADILATKTAAGTEHRVELFGQGGDDHLYSEGNSDTLWGGLGNDIAEGRAGGDQNDTLNGGADNDILDGGAGADRLDGGGGYDLVTYLSSADPNGVYVDLSNNTKNAGAAAGDVLVDVESVDGTNAGDTLIGRNFGALIQLQLHGKGGNDHLVGKEGNDYLDGGADQDTIWADDGADRLMGQGGDDDLDGDSGNDTIDGGLGNDTMSGGLGDDVYYVDDTKDDVWEIAGQGTDEVFVAVDFDFRNAAVERITLIGKGNYRVAANQFDNGLVGNDGHNEILGGLGLDTIQGGNGNDSLDGGGGADRLEGGEGFDLVTYLSSSDAEGVYVDLSDSSRNAGAAAGDVLVDVESVDGTNAADTLIGKDFGGAVQLQLHGKGGRDRLIGKGGNDYLYGGADQDIIEGDVGNDRLDGGDGDDILNGGLGADIMVGGKGNDSYTIDDAGDIVSELGDEGVDTVVTAFDLDISASAVENVTLIGTANRRIVANQSNNHIVGNDGSNVVLGGSGQDTIQSGHGDDVLDGGAGADRLEGGSGNDVYSIDDASDVVVEAAGGGTDTAIVSLNFRMDQLASVEVLKLADGSTATQASGGAGNDRLIGNGNFNILDGGAGVDTLEGGAGSDVFVVDSAADVVVETVGGGADAVQTRVSYMLAGDMEVEFLTALGSDAIALTGNAFANTLSGNAGGNVLSGGDGNDIADGFDGNDRLLGGSGSDRLAGGAGRDFLIGEVGNDTVGGGLGNDTLEGGKGSGSRDRFVFDTKISKKDYKASKDVIKDFGSRFDDIYLDDGAFTNKTIASFLKKKHGASADKPVKLDSRFISMDGKAHDGNDFVLVKKVNSKTAKIYFDQDGSGRKYGALEVATVTLYTKEGAHLTKADFWFI